MNTLPLLLDPLNPLFALGIFVIALMTAAILNRWQPQVPDQSGRLSSIDGLRGILVVGVFIHHSAIWYFFLTMRDWLAPPSNFFTNLGQGGVAMFFMITSFLFMTKLLNAERKPINWTHLYTSRALRLGPMYFFSMLIFFLILFYMTGMQLHGDLRILLLDSLSWIAFSAMGNPDLNGMRHTLTINAGVVWSLRSEWLFYACLPLMACLLRLPRHVALLLAIAGGGAVALLAFRYGYVAHALLKIFLPFVGGIVAAFAARSERLRGLCAGPLASVVALACAGAAVTSFPSAYQLLAVLLLSIAFVIISCGNAMFGTLVWPSTRLLGDMGYSIYLLHGIVLFVVFKSLLFFGVPIVGSVFAHWSIIAIVSIFLVVLCYMTFKLIELPAMRAVPNVVRYLTAKPPKASPSVS